MWVDVKIFEMVENTQFCNRCFQLILYSGHLKNYQCIKLYLILFNGFMTGVDIPSFLNSPSMSAQVGFPVFRSCK